MQACTQASLGHPLGPLYSLPMKTLAPTESPVALRDHREKLIDDLSTHFATGAIDVDDFETRLTRVHDAKTMAECNAIVADLAPPVAAEQVTIAPLIIEPSLVAPGNRIDVLFGNVERGGGWVVPPELVVRARFGNVELDFREARFTSPVTVLHAHVLFGNVELIVPPHLAVQSEGSSLFGNIESRASAVTDPDRPLLRVVGNVKFGNIEIATRLPRNGLIVRR